MFSQNYPTKNYYILNFLTKTSYSNFFQVVQTPYLLRSFLTEFHQIIKHQNANLKETAIQNNATKGRKRQKKFKKRETQGWQKKRMFTHRKNCSNQCS